MENVIAILEEYVETCVTCSIYLGGGCGYIDNTLKVSDDFWQWYDLLDEETKISCTTIRSNKPCEKQTRANTILKDISQALSNSIIIIDEEHLQYYIFKLYSIKQKVIQREEHFREIFSENVDDAIENIIANIDFAFLQANKDIKEYVKMADINYDRDINLSKLCPMNFIKKFERDSCSFPDENKHKNYVSVPYNFENSTNEEKVLETVNNKYQFEIPAGISAVDEFILRFGGWDGKNPIAVLLIKAGFGDFVWGEMWDKDNTTKDGWAEIHSEEWKRYQFSRQKELKEEISREIKNRLTDLLDLKKYICKLITHFDRFDYFALFNTDAIEYNEARALVDAYSNQYTHSTDEYISLWKPFVKRANVQFRDKNTNGEEYYSTLVSMASDEIYDNPSDKDNPEAMAFWYRSRLPEYFSGLLEGCLLENGAPFEYMDYQKMCGVDLVDSVNSFSVANAMEWTEDFVFSYNPRCVDKYLIRNIAGPLEHQEEQVEKTYDETKEISQFDGTQQRLNLVREEYHISNDIVDDNLHLKVSMAKFVRYCTENDLFDPYIKQAWTPIDGILYSQQGKVICAKQLAQSYQDQVVKGYIFPKNKK